jgi:hypothetical protein
MAQGTGWFNIIRIQYIKQDVLSTCSILLIGFFLFPCAMRDEPCNFIISLTRPNYIFIFQQ